AAVVADPAWRDPARAPAAFRREVRRDLDARRISAESPLRAAGAVVARLARRPWTGRRCRARDALWQALGAGSARRTAGAQGGSPADRADVSAVLRHDDRDRFRRGQFGVAFDAQRTRGALGEALLRPAPLHRSVEGACARALAQVRPRRG